MTRSEPDARSGEPIGLPVDATPAQKPGPVTLTGRFGQVTRLDAARHADDLWAAVKDDDTIWTYLGYGPFPGAATFRNWVAEREKLADPYSYAIVNADGRAVGIATLMEIRPAMRVIEVGNIFYGTPLQRTPLATEAQFLLARYVFETLGHRRYEWKCNALNAPSRRAAARFGFSYEGLFRNHLIVKGRSRDTAWFSMLDDEWPVRKRAFERWLAPENFDDSGRQRMSLLALNQAEGRLGDMAVRRAAVSDVAAIVALKRDAYAPYIGMIGSTPRPLELNYHEIVRADDVWVVDAPEGLDAALVLQSRPDDLLIFSIAVAPHTKHRGLGRALLDFAEGRARALGHRAVRLYTHEKMADNVAWYLRHGYARERVEELADRRLVHMIKKLAT